MNVTKIAAASDEKKPWDVLATYNYGAQFPDVA